MNGWKSGRRRKPSWRRRSIGVLSTEYAVLRSNFSVVGDERVGVDCRSVRWKNEREILIALGPLNRTMARPPRPGADERATMVSWMSAIMRVVRELLP